MQDRGQNTAAIISIILIWRLWSSVGIVTQTAKYEIGIVDVKYLGIHVRATTAWQRCTKSIQTNRTHRHPPVSRPRVLKRKAAAAHLSTLPSWLPMTWKAWRSKESCFLLKASGNLRLVGNQSQRSNINASLLSPRLMERFAHLVSDPLWVP